jgi:bifunctional enzyme CysN/CysC
MSHDLDITKAFRASIKKQKPCCVWLTGLSGAGKSTIAKGLEKELYNLGKHTYIIDGDTIRNGINADLDFTNKDREENIRRISEISKLMVEAGLIVIVSAISPFAKDRKKARDLFNKDEFIEVFIDCPLEECENRDVKGLYSRAREGKILNFTGIDSPYEKPLNPEIHIMTANESAAESIQKIINQIYLYLSPTHQKN